MAYKHQIIERKWQHYWRANHTFETSDSQTKPKYYVMDMFPYPSGQGLHVGHPEGYTATDIMARLKRMQGFNVLHPMGWDAFGLPAEQYALKTGHNPKDFTAHNIKNFKRQIRSLGFSYDWSREINTTDESYYNCPTHEIRRPVHHDLIFVSQPFFVELWLTKKSSTVKRSGAVIPFTAYQCVSGF